MLYLDITYDLLLDFATEIIEEHSTKKEEDLIQIKKFRQRLKQNIENDPWKHFIEGWVTRLASKYDVSIEKHIRKEKIKKIKKN